MSVLNVELTMDAVVGLGRSANISVALEAKMPSRDSAAQGNTSVGIVVNV